MTLTVAGKEADPLSAYCSFPVNFSFYTLHAWLLCSVHHCLTFGTADEFSHFAAFKGFPEQVDVIATAISQNKADTLTATLRNAAPTSQHYLASMMATVKQDFQTLDDSIRAVFEPWLDEVEELSDRDKVTAFEDFYNFNFSDDKALSAYYKACYNYVFSSHLIYLAYAWAVIKPTTLNLVYSVSDYYDDLDDYTEWDPAFARCSHVYVYVDTGKNACAKCGEVKPAYVTYDNDWTD